MHNVLGYVFVAIMSTKIAKKSEPIDYSDEFSCGKFSRNKIYPVLQVVVIHELFFRVVFQS